MDLIAIIQDLIDNVNKLLCLTRIPQYSNSGIKKKSIKRSTLKKRIYIHVHVYMNLELLERKQLSNININSNKLEFINGKLYVILKNHYR